MGMQHRIAVSIASQNDMLTAGLNFEFNLSSQNGRLQLVV